MPNEALPGVLGNSGKGFYFRGRGIGEQRTNFEGNRGTKTILGNREHKKTNFDFWGTWEQAYLFQGNKGGGGDSIPARGLGLAENDGFHMA